MSSSQNRDLIIMRGAGHWIVHREWDECFMVGAKKISAEYEDFLIHPLEDPSQALAGLCFHFLGSRPDL